MDEMDTLQMVKYQAINQNIKVITKNLFIKEDQCITRIIKFYSSKGNELNHTDEMTMQEL